MFLRSPAISGTGDGSFRRSPLPAHRVWRWGEPSENGAFFCNTDSDVKMIQSETTTTFISVLHTEYEGFQCVPRIYASLSIKPHVRPRRRALKLYNLQEEKIDSVQVLGWTDFCLSKRGGEKRLRYLVGYMKRR